MANRIIAISGMPGAGKSIVSDVAREMGYPVYSMGDVVRNEAARLGLEETPDNLGMITLDLRKKNGPTIVARMLVDQIRKDTAHTVVVEGVRSVDEVREFQKHFKVHILAVVSVQEVRYSRLKARGRSDDPRDIAEFSQRDERELGLGISNVIESADVRIPNENDETTFRHRVREALVELSTIG